MFSRVNQYLKVAEQNYNYAALSDVTKTTEEVSQTEESYPKTTEVPFSFNGHSVTFRIHDGKMYDDSPAALFSAGRHEEGARQTSLPSVVQRRRIHSTNSLPVNYFLSSSKDKQEKICNAIKVEEEKLKRAEELLKKRETEVSDKKRAAQDYFHASLITAIDTTLEKGGVVMTSSDASLHSADCENAIDSFHRSLDLFSVDNFSFKSLFSC